jgi:GT2 family glycosyltransferase
MSTVETAAVVVTWEGGEATERCVESLLAERPGPDLVVVVDNASADVEREALRRRWAAAERVRLVLLAENRHFAGGMNAGAGVAFAAGASSVLFLNNDTVVQDGAFGRLVQALGRCPGAGIVGPLVRDRADPRRVISAGEHHGLLTLCVPRTLLRPRVPASLQPYPVRGVMGCALLVSRSCFEAVGGFSETIQVYYEDVDFCLAAAAAGQRVWIEPRAVVEHDGMRGFARGLTPWAALLKARNPWLVMRRHRARLAWLVFLPTYASLIAASACGYLVRGRRDVARALLAGAAAGACAAAGAPVRPVGSPREVG